MMDGQVLAIREALDEAGSSRSAILAYAAKYASALYGPFRDAVDVSIADGGDRKDYQQDFRNASEAMEEIRFDVDEGADMVMVKPALAYLDVIARARAELDIPLAAYHVSGEYAMIHAAAERGWIDGPAVGARAPHGDQARRRRSDPHVLRPRSRRGCSTGDARAGPTTRPTRAVRVAAGESSPAASTRRSAPSARSAAPRTS